MTLRNFSSINWMSSFTELKWSWNRESWAWLFSSSDSTRLWINREEQIYSSIICLRSCLTDFELVRKQQQQKNAASNPIRVCMNYHHCGMRKKSQTTWWKIIIFMKIALAVFLLLGHHQDIWLVLPCQGCKTDCNTHDHHLQWRLHGNSSAVSNPALLSLHEHGPFFRKNRVSNQVTKKQTITFYQNK